MTNNKWLWLSVIGTLSGASVAAAQHGGPHEMHGGEHEMPHSCPHDMAKLDPNGDGVVTTAEFEAGAVARWTQSDANHDGKVTLDEMKAQCAAMHEGAMHSPESFAKVDANSDGKIERSEIAKMPDPMFKKLDTDKNGSLSAAEFEKGHPMPNGKGMGGAHAEHAEMMKMMKTLPGDANNDGALTKAEAQAEAQKMAKQLDTNSDGKLSKEELAAMHEMHEMHGMPMHDGAAHGHGRPMKEEAGHGGMHHPAPAPKPVTK